MASAQSIASQLKEHARPQEVILRVRPDVQEAAPTADQLSSILEYLGPSKAGSVVKDATGSSDALRKFKQNESAFQRPVVVDWNNGRAGML